MRLTRTDKTFVGVFERFFISNTCSFIRIGGVHGRVDTNIRKSQMIPFDLARLVNGRPIKCSRGTASRGLHCVQLRVKEKGENTYDAHACTKCAWWEVGGEF